jgi:hypothetical protein
MYLSAPSRERSESLAFRAARSLILFRMADHPHVVAANREKATRELNPKELRSLLRNRPVTEVTRVAPESLEVEVEIVTEVTGAVSWTYDAPVPIDPIPEWGLTGTAIPKPISDDRTPLPLPAPPEEALEAAPPARGSAARVAPAAARPSPATRALLLALALSSASLLGFLVG